MKEPPLLENSLLRKAEDATCVRNEFPAAQAECAEFQLENLEEPVWERRMA